MLSAKKKKTGYSLRSNEYVLAICHTENDKEIQQALNESIHLFLIQIFLIYRIFVKEYFVESKRSIRWAADMRHNLPFVPVSTDHLNPSSSSSSTSSPSSTCSSSSSLPLYISVFCWSRSKTGANNTTCPAF